MARDRREERKEDRKDEKKPDVTDPRFRARPELWRSSELKKGEWRYDVDFARDINPHTFREKHGYGRGRK